MEPVPDVGVDAHAGVVHADAGVGDDHAERLVVDACLEHVGASSRAFIGVQYAVATGFCDSEADVLRLLIIDLEVLAEPRDRNACERHLFGTRAEPQAQLRLARMLPDSPLRRRLKRGILMGRSETSRSGGTLVVRGLESDHGRTSTI